MFKKSLMIVLLLSAIHVFGAELDQSGKAGGLTQGHNSETGEWPGDLAGVSVDADLNFSRVGWKLAGASCSDLTLSPQIGISYAINRIVAPRVTVKYCQARDNDSTLSIWDIGLGGRIWIPTDWLLVPFFGATFNYYDLSLSQAGNVKGACGVTGEVGAGYFINDNFVVTLNISGATSLVDGQATADNRDENISLNALSLGVGINARF